MSVHGRRGENATVGRGLEGMGASTGHDGGLSEEASGPADATIAATLHDQPNASVPSESGTYASIAPGSTLGRYVVLDRLGRGGMGTVLRAYDQSLDRAVALKLLHPGASEHYAKRLEREARALAKVSHPNVVHVYEVGQHEGQWFIAMELVKGQTLRAWQRGEHGWAQTVEVYLQAAAGLEAAHALGMVHRDFKPDNCIMDEQGRLKVLDFGLVRQTQASERGPGTEVDPLRTRPGKILGTLGYMPLEQISGKPVDARSDQFSFCVSLYEALYGVRPFGADEVGPLTISMMKGAIDDAPRGPRVPSKLRRILVQGLATSADDRWPSMDALSTELRRLLAPSRSKWWIPALGVGAVAVGLWGWQREERARPCADSPQQLEGTWDDARRERVRSAMAGTGVAYATSAWERAERRLDDYGAAWLAEHEDACVATHVHHEQSTQVMDLRMSCLRRARGRLTAAVDLLAEADAKVVARAHRLLEGLPSLERCADVERLLAEVPPPTDPDVVAAVAEARTVLHRVNALRSAGKPREASELLATHEAELETIDYVPLASELSLSRGLLKLKLGEYSEAESLLRITVMQSLAHDQWFDAWHAALGLTNAIGHGRGAPDEALAFAQVAIGLSQREGNSSRIRTTSRLALAMLLRQQGRAAEAEAQIRTALELQEQAGGEFHDGIPQAHSNLANILSLQGRHAEAEQEYQRARDLYVRTLGPAHPRLADTLSNYANMLSTQPERLDESLALSREALSIQEAALGPEHPATAASLNAIAIVLQTKGDLTAAADAFRTVVARLTAAHGLEHPWVGGARTNLGSVMLDLGQVEEAEREVRAGIEIIDASAGPEALAGAAPRVILTKLLLDAERFDEAEPPARKALELRLATHGPEHHEVYSSRYLLAQVLSLQGQPLAAIDSLEKGLPLETLESIHIASRVEVRLLHANLLWDESHDRARAVQLIREIRDVVADDPELSEQRESLDGWLGDHALSEG